MLSLKKGSPSTSKSKSPFLSPAAEHAPVFDGIDAKRGELASEVSLHDVALEAERRQAIFDRALGVHFPEGKYAFRVARFE